MSEILKGVGTSIPAHILSFDTATQLAKVQVAIEFVGRDLGGFTIAPIINCPVNFSGGDNFILEHQVDLGDEGLLIISQRCIDGWIEQGNIAPQPVVRKLDMQDGLFLHGFRSKPKAITAFANDGMRIRNKAGTHSIWLKKNGDILVNNSSADFIVKADGSIKGSNSAGHFELLAGGNVNINGVIIDVAGNITSPAVITGLQVAAPSILGNGKELSDHAHSQGNDSAGNTQVNTSANL